MRPVHRPLNIASLGVHRRVAKRAQEEKASLIKNCGALTDPGTPRRDFGSRAACFIESSLPATKTDDVVARNVRVVRSGV